MSVDISGAIDLHCHFGPDAHRARSVTALEAAAQARDAGHAAVLLKSHTEPTAQLARIVADVVDGINVYGGVCCDHEMGGLNPAAVETALGLGGRIVWLPTLSSRQDVVNGVAEQLGIPGPGLVVIDDDGEILPVVREIAALCHEHDAVLATGHISGPEHVAVAREFGSRQKVLVTHAMEDMVGPKLSAPELAELADLGAWIELCALTCVGSARDAPGQRPGRRGRARRSGALHARERLRPGDERRAGGRAPAVRGPHGRRRPERRRDPDDGRREPGVTRDALSPPPTPPAGWRRPRGPG